MQSKRRRTCSQTSWARCRRPSTTAHTKLDRFWGVHFGSLRRQDHRKSSPAQMRRPRRRPLQQMGVQAGCRASRSGAATSGRRASKAACRPAAERRLSAGLSDTPPVPGAAWGQRQPHLGSRWRRQACSRAPSRGSAPSLTTAHMRLLTWCTSTAGGSENLHLRWGCSAGWAGPGAASMPLGTQPGAACLSSLQPAEAETGPWGWTWTSPAGERLTIASSLDSGGPPVQGSAGQHVQQAVRQLLLQLGAAPERHVHVGRS